MRLSNMGQHTSNYKKETPTRQQACLSVKLELKDFLRTTPFNHVFRAFWYSTIGVNSMGVIAPMVKNCRAFDPEESFVTAE